MGFHVIKNDELYHHGILGMKWGVRRYQSYSTRPRVSGEGGKEIGKAKRTSKIKEKIKSIDTAKVVKTAKLANKLTRNLIGAYMLLSLFNPGVVASIKTGKKVIEKTFDEAGVNLYKGNSLSKMTYKDLEKLDLW